MMRTGQRAAGNRRATTIRRDVCILAGVLLVATALLLRVTLADWTNGGSLMHSALLLSLRVLLAGALVFFVWRRWREARDENHIHQRTEETLRLQHGYLAALHETSLGLMDRLAPEDVLRTIVTRAGELLGTSHGFVDLLTPDGARLEAAVCTGLFRHNTGVTIQRGTGLSGKVWETGQPIVVDDYCAWSGRLPTAPGGVLAAIAVPLVSGGQFHGALGLAYTDPGKRFGEHEVALLVRFAHLAAIALDNAHLYRAAQHELHERERAQAQLHESEAQYRLLFEANPQPMWVFDLETLAFLAVNDAAVANYGYTRDEFLAMTLKEIRPPTEVAAVVTSLATRDREPGERRLFKHRKKDGTIIDVAVRLNDMTFAGRKAGLVLATDITERIRAQAELQESEERYRRLVEQSPEAILVHCDERYVYANEAAVRLLGGKRPEEIVGRSVLDFVVPEDAALVRERAHQTYTQSGTAKTMLEVKRRRLDGEIRVTEAFGIPITYNGRDGAQVIYRDITERKRVEEQLVHTALHDALTGLPNRSLFMDRLKQSLERRKRQSAYQFAVLFVDFDRFKNVNDSLGHVQGDRLLRVLAQRLAKSLDPAYTIARLGGDEFAILANEITGTQDAIRIAEQLQRAMTPPVVLRGSEVFISASIGIAISARGYSRPEEMLRDADTAMYRAKALGAGRHVVFDSAMHARVVALLQLENDLRRAIARDEFQVLYQPIVSLTTAETIGFEALVRWRHPRLGLLSPADFIPLAEETGLIIPLDQWILREACRQMRIWQGQFPALPHLSISVNISGKQFAQPDFLDHVTRILAETGLDTHRLKLEITESALIGQAEMAEAVLWRMRAAGIHVQLDDFGVGYSSLSYLHRFPIDTLKIDRSFVSSAGMRNENAEIIRAIVTLAHNLNIDVIAEGIETTEQQAHVQALECDLGQGYYFSLPLHAGMAERLLIECTTAEIAAD